jgi:hypothetical protein
MHEEGMNPFELGLASLTDRIRQIIEAVDKMAELSPPQRLMFSHYIVQAYSMRGYEIDRPETWQSQRLYSKVQSLLP